LQREKKLGTQEPTAPSGPYFAQAGGPYPKKKERKKEEAAEELPEKEGKRRRSIPDLATPKRKKITKKRMNITA